MERETVTLSDGTTAEACTFSRKEGFAESVGDLIEFFAAELANDPPAAIDHARSQAELAAMTPRQFAASLKGACPADMLRTAIQLHDALHAPVAPGDEIRKRFAAMEPGPKRTKFYRENRSILAQ